HVDFWQARPGKILHPGCVRSDGIYRLNLCPDLGCAPPVMKFNSHARMIRHPFCNDTLCGGVTAMAVNYQDAFESLLCHRIQNIPQDGHVCFDSQRYRSGKGSKIWRQPVSEHWKHRHADRLRCFNSQAFGQNAIYAQTEVSMLLGTTQWQDCAI